MLVSAAAGPPGSRCTTQIAACGSSTSVHAVGKSSSLSLPAIGAHQRRSARRCAASAAAAAFGAKKRRRAVRTTVAAAAAGNGNGGDPPIVVAGAGIAGLAAAAALHKAGFRTLVLERAPALRDEGAAIALWANAWRALDALGAGNAVRAAARAPLLTRFELVRSDGRPLRAFRLDECDAARAGGDDAEFRGVRRGAVLEALAAQLPPGCVRLGVGVDSIEAAGGAADGSSGTSAVARLSDGSLIECAALVAADGAASGAARALGLAAPRYAGYTAYRGVARLGGGSNGSNGSSGSSSGSNGSNGSGSGLPLPPDTVRQIYGSGVRAGMYPLSEDEVYWFTCFNAAEDAPAPATPEARAAEALAAVDGWAWGIADAIRRTPPEALSRSRIRDRWPLALPAGRGLVTLAGDALHPMTPNLGQGGCAALEDAVVLARELKAAADDAAAAGGGSGSGAAAAAAREAALRRYEAERRRRCLPLAARSWAFGFLLQLPYAPVTAARDAFMERAFSPAHFLDHTAYDCGVIV